jgi:hypothetical protein
VHQIAPYVGTSPVQFTRLNWHYKGIQLALLPNEVRVQTYKLMR